MEYVEKILIVDDEKPIREVLKLMANLKGLEADLAEDGLDALLKMDQLRKIQQSYPLVCTDLFMPNLDGSGLIKKIEEKVDSGEILPPEIIILTGYNPKITTQTNESALNIRYHLKPCDLRFMDKLNKIYRTLIYPEKQ